MSEQKKSKHDFYFNTGLYETVSEEEIDEDFLIGDVEGYNFIAKTETTFSITIINFNNSYYSYDPCENSQNYFESKYILVELKCKRYGDIYNYFIKKIKDEKDENLFYRKVGQSPSLADIGSVEVNKLYKKYVDGNHLHFYEKAVGLFSHGIGAGSLIYLRKIFEETIERKFIDNISAEESAVSNFKNKKMEDKIKCIKKYLPNKIDSFRSVYSLMSAGVHTLGEDKCNNIFPLIRVVIKLIWQQEKDMAIEKESNKMVNDEINKYTQELGKSTNK